MPLLRVGSLRLYYITVLFICKIDFRGFFLCPFGNLIENPMVMGKRNCVKLTKNHNDLYIKQKKCESNHKKCQLNVEITKFVSYNILQILHIGKKRLFPPYRNH